MAGVERRRHRHLLGRRALHRRDREGLRPDLGNHSVRARHGFAHARDFAGLAAPRLGRRVPRRASSGDRGVHRDPQTLGRLQSQEPEPAPRHLHHRRIHAGGARRSAVRAAQPEGRQGAAHAVARASCGRRSSRRGCRPASPTCCSATRPTTSSRRISASSASRCASRTCAARSCCPPASITWAARAPRCAACRR